MSHFLPNRLKENLHDNLFCVCVCFSKLQTSFNMFLPQRFFKLSTACQYRARDIAIANRNTIYQYFLPTRKQSDINTYLIYIQPDKYQHLKSIKKGTKTSNESIFVKLF